MRAPSPVLVIDAAILIAALLGRSAGALRVATSAAVLLVTDRAIEETRRRLDLGLGRADLLPLLDALVSELTVVPVLTLEPLLPTARKALVDAVTSRNGSTRDAHVLALAWSVDGDVWTTDRDFAGTGVASWSTPNLMRALLSVSAQDDQVKAMVGATGIEPVTPPV